MLKMGDKMGGYTPRLARVTFPTCGYTDHNTLPALYNKQITKQTLVYKYRQTKAKTGGLDENGPAALYRTTGKCAMISLLTV